MTLIAIIAVALLLLRPESRELVDSSRPEFERCLETGQKALSTGKVMLAANEFQRAIELRQLHPERHASFEGAQLGRLHRQAKLLAELSAEPLEAILHHGADAIRLDPLEWKSTFVRRYQGRGVVFDTEIRRDAQGVYHANYAVFFRGKRHILDLGAVPCFEVVPWPAPQRLIFGIRLADIVPGPEGIWTIRFDPDTGVLLTDLGAASLICGQPAEDLREAIQRQADWVSKHP